jgi:hypothetical protein
MVLVGYAFVMQLGLGVRWLVVAATAAVARGIIVATPSAIASDGVVTISW